MEPNPSRQSRRALDWLNLFLADVRDGVGPYLTIYLGASLHWNPAQIGVAMAASGFATVVAQTPAGALIDRLRAKRTLIIVASICVALGCVVTILRPTLPVVLSGQILCGVAGAIFPPAIAAITLGLVGHRAMARRVGRNESWNHAGNVLAAALAGLIGFYIAREGIFLLVAAMAVGSSLAALFIRPQEIDHELARGAKEGAGGGRVCTLRELFSDRRLLIFSATTVLFHFANAAMLPLVGQKLSLGVDHGASLYMSACIIIAQLVMVPVAAWAGHRAGSWGRRPVFLVACLVLPLRGLLYTLSDNPVYLVAVQALDGIGAGIFGVLVVLIVADLTAATGRFNFAQGALATATGIGAALSNLMTGYILAHAGFTVAFLVLTGIALLALGLFWSQMPETNGDAAAAADLRTA